MDHARIERDALLERYVQGHLPPPVEEELEEHVVACSSCQDDLEAIRGLALGVRSVASQDAARLAVQVSLLARLRHALGSPRRTAWVTAGALLIVVGVLSGYAGWLRVENMELRTTIAKRAGQEGTPGASPATTTGEDGGRTGAEGPVGDVHEQDRLAALERTLPAAVGSVVLLSEVRGAPGDADASAPTIDPGSLDGPFALAVYILDDPRFTSYRMQVLDAEGKVRWQRSGLVPNAFEALMATFPPDFFPPGSYRVRVVGLTPAGDAVPLESYPFGVA